MDTTIIIDFLNKIKVAMRNSFTLFGSLGGSGVIVRHSATQYNNFTRHDVCIVLVKNTSYSFSNMV